MNRLGLSIDPPSNATMLELPKVRSSLTSLKLWFDNALEGAGSNGGCCPLQGTAPCCPKQLTDRAGGGGHLPGFRRCCKSSKSHSQGMLEPLETDPRCPDPNRGPKRKFAVVLRGAIPMQTVLAPGQWGIILNTMARVTGLDILHFILKMAFRNPSRLTRLQSLEGVTLMTTADVQGMAALTRLTMLSMLVPTRMQPCIQQL